MTSIFTYFIVNQSFQTTQSQRENLTHCFLLKNITLKKFNSFFYITRLHFNQYLKDYTSDKNHRDERKTTQFFFFSSFIIESWKVFSFRYPQLPQSCSSSRFAWFGYLYIADWLHVLCRNVALAAETKRSRRTGSYIGLMRLLGLYCMWGLRLAYDPLLYYSLFRMFIVLTVH